MFLSSYENKLDKKGRVSVPATFRSHLSSLGYNGFISYPSFNHSSLECCSQDRIEKLSNTIDTLNPFEDKTLLGSYAVYLFWALFVFPTVFGRKIRPKGPGNRRKWKN